MFFCLIDFRITGFNNLLICANKSQYECKSWQEWQEWQELNPCRPDQIGQDTAFALSQLGQGGGLASHPLWSAPLVRLLHRGTGSLSEQSNRLRDLHTPDNVCSCSEWIALKVPHFVRSCLLLWFAQLQVSSSNFTSS